MSDYYWDSQFEYLLKTRGLYYNDDYLEFLINYVWKLHKPINVVDFGCGYGFLGLKLLPLLPTGSSYTGFDKSKELIEKARNLHANCNYQSDFYEADLEEYAFTEKYDVAICQAFLLHLTNPKAMLERMASSVVPGGMVICFEPHWISNMSNLFLDGAVQSEIAYLGALQKLYERDTRDTGKDGNIGIKLPFYMSQIGLSEIDCRVSDKVNFLDLNNYSEGLYESLRTEGLGTFPGKQDEVVVNLINRGLSPEEAVRQYDAEMNLANSFKKDSFLTYAPSMKITFGRVSQT